MPTPKQNKLIASLLLFLKDNRIKAFLWTIRKCEGTAYEDGYNYLFGSTPKNSIRFSGNSTHPRIHRPFGKTTSTAAGAYQIMHRTFEDLVKIVGLTDFSPQTQDIFAVQLLGRRGAISLILNNEIEKAFLACNKEWASLPLSPYNQNPKDMDTTMKYYNDELNRLENEK